MAFLVISAILVVVLFQLAVQILAGIDLGRRKRVRGDNRWIWVWVILLGFLPGALVYLLVGRLDDGPTGGSDPRAGGV